MSRACLVVLAAFGEACVSAGARQPERYFVLEQRATTPARFSVRVAPTTASSFYDTQEIAYSRAAGTRAYYQFNRWTERPQRLVEAALAARLEGDGAETGLVLRTNLDEMYHDAVQPPGSARVAVTAQLVGASGTVLASRRFTQTAPAVSYDAAGAVRGFDEALGALVDEVVAWIGSQRAAGGASRQNER